MTTTYKLMIPLQQAALDIASSFAEERLAATAISVLNPQAGNGFWKFEAYLPAPPDQEDLDELGKLLNDDLPKEHKLEIESIPDQDWVSKVQSSLSPVYAGNFVIHGSHDKETLKSHPLRLQIEAGQAFGTAHHGTTKGCLLALERLYKKQNFLNVLDLGTGSGILAIAAAKLCKTGFITASDIDEVSTRVARENTKVNGVPHLIDIVCARGLQHNNIQDCVPFDLIIANILAKPLVQLRSEISNALCLGGYIILSGLLKEQCRYVERSYTCNKFKLINRLPHDEWMTLIMQKQA